MINHVVPIEQKLRTFSLTQTLKIAFLPIFLALFVSTIFDQFINSKIESILKSQQGLSSTIWGYGFLSIFTSLLAPLVVSLFACYALSNSVTVDGFEKYKKPNLKSFFSEKFELSALETLRSWGVAFLWCFLFIIPGIIKFGFYLLTPFVVFFSEKYQVGEVDALKLSEKIFKKFWIRLSCYYFLFTLFIPLALSMAFDEYHLFSQHLFSASLLTAIDTVIIILFHYFILGHFLKYLKESESTTEFKESPHVAYV